MGTFERFWKREKLIRKSIEIDNILYDKLALLAKTKYQASTNKLVNACIEELIKTRNVKVYRKIKENKKDIPVQRSLLIRESLVKELEQLKEEYNLSVSKLVNISINNAIEEEEKNSDK